MTSYVGYSRMFAKPYYGDYQLILNRRFLKFGFMLHMATSSKIIYDEVSDQMYTTYICYHIDILENYLTPYRHISGFKFIYRPDEPQGWQDLFFYRFGLALHDRNPGGLMPGIERNKADWKEDENGRVW